MTFDDDWSAIPLRAQAPEGLWGRNGAGPVHPHDKRRFARFRCRARSILERPADRLAGYLVDISRSGIGIISPVQLFPRGRIALRTHDRRITLKVVRCRRLGQDCYHCGCVFLLSADSAEARPPASQPPAAKDSA